jgi:BON domain-containing protein
MSEQRTAPEFEPEELEAELEAELENTTPIVGTGDLVDSDDGLTGQERYEGYLDAGVDPTGDSLEALGASELRTGETIDPLLAAEEGLTWIPPTDPVVVPDATSPEGLRVATGFGTTALDEPYDADHHGDLLPAEDEMTDRVREALRADAATSRYADALKIDTEGGIATIRGTVDDILDSDDIIAVASEVTGIIEVRDHLNVRGV